MLIKSKYLPIGVGLQVRYDLTLLPYPIYWTGKERGWYNGNKHGKPYSSGGSWENTEIQLWYLVVPKSILMFGDD